MRGKAVKNLKRNMIKNMGKKKSSILIVTMLLITMLSATTLRAQVFLMEDEFESNIRVGGTEFVVPAPYQGGDLDQYLPIGDGLLLLVGMGGAYLLGKRKKKDD